MNARIVMPIIAAALSTLVACGGAEGRKEKYLEQAEASFQAGDYEKARINFKNVLQIDPKDIKGREGVARTLEKLQDWRGAVAQYRTIIEQDPNNLGAKVKLGQLYLLAKASDLALTLAEEVLAVQGTNDGALAVKAGAKLQMGSIEEALVNAEQAFKINGNSIDNIVLLGSIYAASGRVEDAITFLENEQNKYSTSNSIHAMLSRFYISTERLALAEKSLQRLVELNQDDIAYKNQLARFYIGTGRGNEAESLLVEAAGKSPLDVDAVSSLHSFYLQRDQVSNAEMVLTDAISQHPDVKDLQLKLAAYYVSQKRNDEARKLYESLREGDKSTALKASTRLAYMDLLDNKVDQALEKLAGVLKENPSDVEALTLRGGIYLSDGKAVDAIADLRAVLGATPDSPDVIKMLGRAHLINGESQQAIDLFKAALSLQPRDVSLRIQLADVFLDIKELNQAANQIELASQLQPENYGILEKLVMVYIQGKYLDDAESVISKLRTVMPDSPRNSYYAGLVAQMREQHELALQLFEESFALKPGAIEPMTAKVKSYIALKRIDDAIRWLTAVIVDVDDNPVAHNLLGELWLAKKDWKKARDAFDHSVSLKPEWWIPYRNIALAENGQGGEKSGFAYLQSVVDEVDSVPLRIEAANQAERLGNFDFAIEQYESVLAKNPDNKIIVNNLIMLIVTHKSDTQALQRATELSVQLEGVDNPFFMDTAGWVHYLNGDYDRALSFMQQAARGAPEEPSIQYHLAMVYWGSNDRDNAARYLEKALASEKPFMGREKAEKILAELKQQS